MSLVAPSIWTPSRKLWRPSLGAMMAHLRKGASGHLLKHASNGHLVKGCDSLWYRAKRCRDDAYVDYWIPSTETFPYYFKLDEVCYYALDSHTSSSSQETEPEGHTEHSDCTPCEYIQAKRCRDGVAVDLWRLASDGVPYYFSKSSVCYYIEDGNPTSDTPGTVLDGTETAKTSCLDCSPPCLNCPNGTPFRFEATLENIVLCNTTCTARQEPFWAPASDLMTGSAPAGTFTLDRTTETGCSTWRVVFPQVIRWRIWGSNKTCSGSPSSDCSTVDLHITLTRTSSTVWTLTVGSFGTPGCSMQLFSGTKNTGVTDCRDPFVISSTYAVCYPGGPPSGSYDGQATGGTATITPIL